MKKFVYFIKPIGADGPVKIGFSEAPKKRLEQLSVWSPVPLEVVATHPGDVMLEKKLHEYFRASHSHREWFHITPELSRLIQAISSGAAISDVIDLCGIKPRALARVWTKDHSRRRSYYTRIYHSARRVGEIFPPKQIRSIMDVWSGHHGHPQAVPSREQIDVLEQFIANPAAFLPSQPQEASA